MILYSMGLGYGEVMGRRISEMRISNLAVYEKFTDPGNHTGMERFHTPPLLKLVIRDQGRTDCQVGRQFLLQARPGKTVEESGDDWKRWHLTEEMRVGRIV